MTKKRKKSIIGYTSEDWDMLWTVYNTLNIACIIQKTKFEAMARYDDLKDHTNIRKVRVTIEEVD